MITHAGKQFLKSKRLEKRIEELEKKIERKERELELMGIAKEDVVSSLDDVFVPEQAHIFAVSGPRDNGHTFLSAAEGVDKSAARDNLRKRIPAACYIHCHIGEINEMVGTKPTETFK